MNRPKIVVIGKNGKTGARVLTLLQQRAIACYGVSRSTQPAFDWQDSRNWEAALAGADSLYITFQPDLAVPMAEMALQQLVEEARRQGIRHLVLLSGRGEPGAQRAEAVVQNSGLDWNIVRASWFMQNFSESFLLDGIRQGELVLPVGEVTEPFVDVDDIAEVVVACLTRPALRNRLFEVTGPQLLSFADCVAAIAEQLGRPLSYRQVPMRDYQQALEQAGLPAEMIALLRELFTEVLDGRNSHTAEGIQQALGRAPTAFADYVSKTLAGHCWQQQEVSDARL